MLGYLLHDIHENQLQLLLIIQQILFGFSSIKKSLKDILY